MIAAVVVDLTEETAYNAGVQAYYADLADYENPYDIEEEFILYKAWSRGFKDAATD